jgi:hypothetical protein
MQNARGTGVALRSVASRRRAYRFGVMRVIGLKWGDGDPPDGLI